jgi:GDPmannose 4,6-dehydratase
VCSSDLFFRPSEVDLLLGDASMAHARLGWKPNYCFVSLIKDMMENEI